MTKMYLPKKMFVQLATVSGYGGETGERMWAVLTFPTGAFIHSLYIHFLTS